MFKEHLKVFKAFRLNENKYNNKLNAYLVTFVDHYVPPTLNLYVKLGSSLDDEGGPSGKDIKEER
jgi:hypothetical protein